jgi:hypothetical protein
MKKGFWYSLFLSFLSTLGALGHAQTVSTGRLNQSLKVTIWVNDYARVLPGTLAAAEEEAAMVFRNAGVQLIWVNCPPPGAQLESPCHVPPGTAHFALRILSRPMAEYLSFRAEDLGFALPCPESERGCVASVFYHRVEELAKGGTFPADILGRAIAHEIGHLLLGLNAHSPRGIMRAKWNPEDLRPVATPCLLFSLREAQVIRAQVLARLEAETFPRASTSR